MNTKHHVLAFLCIATLALGGGQNCPAQTTRYAASVPPSADKQFHKTMEQAIKKWIKEKNISFDERSDYSQHSDKQVNGHEKKQSHGHLYRLQLTEDQKNLFQAAFPRLFFGPDDDFGFPPADAGGHEYERGVILRPEWWPSETINTEPVSVYQDAGHTPTIYIIDSGVQWITNAAGTPIHTQFANSRITFLNGRVPPTVGNWPPSTGPWNTIDAVIPSGTPPYSAGGGYLDPNKDPLVHGTKVASTAVGCATDPTSVFGKIGGNTTVSVESIRVYPTAGNPTSLNIADGIYEAVDAHLMRDPDGKARSILVLASRSTSLFSVNVEVALLHAWRSGMIVLCAAGDSATTYVANKASPNALWYSSFGVLPSPTTPQPTSPSRFDIDGAVAHPDYWPNYNDPEGNAIVVPTAADRCYAILVGGNNTTTAAAERVYPYTDQWSSASTAKGPDVDIIVPVKSLPCATITSATSMFDTSGTSFSVGLVAGIAAVFLDHNGAGTTPQQFRDWLLPTTSGPAEGKPWKVTGFANGWFYGTIDPYFDNSWYLREPYMTRTGGNVPKINIKQSTDWGAP